MCQLLGPQNDMATIRLEGGETVIYGFNVSVPTNISKMAARDGVSIRTYRVIYELLDDAKGEMEKLLPAEIVETETGEMKIKGVFRTEKTAIIAGGEVLKGEVKPQYLAKVMHGKEEIGEVEVESVQREKIKVESLVEGETGGIALKLEKKLTLEIGDRLKFFMREVKKRKL